MRLPIRVILIAVVAGAALAACAGKTTKPTPPPEPTAPPPTTEPAPLPRATRRPIWTPIPACVSAWSISISTGARSSREFQAAIACHAKYLQQFPGARVTLEGNADERGTREYNLGLGERRGNAVSSALGAAGASTSQLNVVSYGEERPVCKEHNEECWQKNRRVEIVYTAK